VALAILGPSAALAGTGDKVSSVSSSLPPSISPTHPTLVREPFHCEGWAYGEKYDGWRMLALKEVNASS
jgi:ATP-dependent DNA ligase